MKGIRTTRILVAVTVTLALCTETIDASALGSAVQHPISSSGVRGEILILDTGSPVDGLVISGRASGLDPSGTFVTLIYDAGSIPAGPDACLPTDFSLTSTQMFVGIWQVSPDGSGVLFAQKTGDSYASLGSIGAVSVRDVQGPIPQGAILVACGRVHHIADNRPS